MYNARVAAIHILYPTVLRRDLGHELLESDDRCFVVCDFEHPIQVGFETQVPFGGDFSPYGEHGAVRGAGDDIKDLGPGIRAAGFDA